MNIWLSIAFLLMYYSVGKLQFVKPVLLVKESDHAVISLLRVLFLFSWLLQILFNCLSGVYPLHYPVFDWLSDVLLISSVIQFPGFKKQYFTYLLIFLIVYFWVFLVFLCLSQLFCFSALSLSIVFIYFYFHYLYIFLYHIYEISIIWIIENWGTVHHVRTLLSFQWGFHVIIFSVVNAWLKQKNWRLADAVYQNVGNPFHKTLRQQWLQSKS